MDPRSPVGSAIGTTVAPFSLATLGAIRPSAAALRGSLFSSENRSMIVPAITAMKTRTGIVGFG